MMYRFTGNEQKDYKELNRLYSDAQGMIKAGRSEVALEIKDNAYTKKQRGALHVWCDLCAEYLDSLGEQCEVQHPFIEGETYLLPWTGDRFKQNVYKFVLEAMTGKTSTEDQSTVDPSEVASVIHQRAAQNGKTLPPWPSNLQPRYR